MVGADRREAYYNAQRNRIVAWPPLSRSEAITGLIESADRETDEIGQETGRLILLDGPALTLARLLESIPDVDPRATEDKALAVSLRAALDSWPGDVAGYGL